MTIGMRAVFTPTSAKTRPRSGLRRAAQIALGFFAFALWLAWQRGVMRCDLHCASERFASLLQGLGTTFVKLGQHLSLRADLLPEETQRALARLQAHVAPIPSATAVHEVEAAFGRPWAAVFATFDMQPLAAASIAQIHRATLPDGRDVIVKIRRPGSAEQAEADMRILRSVVRVLQGFVPALARWGLLSVVDEIAANFRLEMDLAREARYVRKFVEAWRGSQEIDIPDVIDGLCTTTVMVQRFSVGTPLESLGGDARARASRRLVDCYVAQIFRDGLFHGDPHPGNLFSLPDGRLCLHDFGIVGRVDRRMRRALAAFALAFVEQDPVWMVDAWMDLGLVAGHVDRAVFIPVVQSLLADCVERPLRDWSLSGALAKLVAAGRAVDLRLPLDLLVLTRAMVLLEGTVRGLAPDFSIFEAISRQAATGVLDAEPKGEPSRRLAYEFGNTATELPALLARRLHAALHEQRLLELTIAPDERFEAGFERASRRIALGLVTLGLYVASSLLMQHGVGPRWGDLPVLALAGYLLAIRFTFLLASDRR